MPTYVKDGSVRAISAWSETRNPVVPQTLTAKEEGYGDLYIWSGMAAPAGVPKDIIAKISAVIGESMKDKPMQDVLKRLGVSSMYMTPEQTAQRIAADTQWVSAPCWPRWAWPPWACSWPRPGSSSPGRPACRGMNRPRFFRAWAC
jgi:tripartite-type tricarboxylate transporter receptor subunit TctC